MKRIAEIIFAVLLASAAGMAQYSPPSGALFSGSQTITTAAGSAAVWSPGGASACFVTISGSWTGSLPFKGSADSASYYQIEGIGQVFRAWYPAATANGDWQFMVAGMKSVEVEGPTSSGSAVVSYSCGQGTAWSYQFATPASIEGVWFNGVDASKTETAGPLFLQGQKQLDWFFFPAGFTGSPSGCKIQIEGSADGVTFYPTTAGTITPATSGYQADVITGVPLGIALKAVWSCSAYPTGGLLYLETTAK